MNSAERVATALSHQEPDRVPTYDLYWPSTIERWHAEGLPNYVSNVSVKDAQLRPVNRTEVSAADYFGLEMARIRPDLSPRLPTELIVEDEETELERTSYGTLRRQRRNRSSTPEVLEWPIKSREDWDRIKPRLEPDPSRVNWDKAQSIYQTARQKGQFVTFHGHVGWAQFLEYFRSDELLMIMGTEPAWAKEMFQVQAELVIGMAEIMIERGLQFDGASLACDLGYRNGTFFSPQMYRELQFPFDKMVFRFFRDRGMPVNLHSDGRVKGLISQLLEAGISCLNPIETKAGMDLIELKKEYGTDLSFMGGIDVRAMADPDPRVIEEEIKRKFEVAMVGGGYIYHSDHSIPNNVSLAQYQHVLELVRQYGAYR